MTLSVILITYNHADYIKQAIESILMQKTNFRFELIIGNDHSTDNTEEVIKNLISETQTDVEITYYNHEQNVGLNPNSAIEKKEYFSVLISNCVAVEKNKR